MELMPIRKIAMHHIDVPAGPCTEIGGYSVQPASGAPMRNDVNRMAAATGYIQKLTRLSHGKATSRAPIMSGMT